MFILSSQIRNYLSDGTAAETTPSTLTKNRTTAAAKKKNGLILKQSNTDITLRGQMGFWGPIGAKRINMKIWFNRSFALFK